MHITVNGRMCFGLWLKDEAQKSKNYEKFEGCFFLVDWCLLLSSYSFSLFKDTEIFPVLLQTLVEIKYICIIKSLGREIKTLFSQTNERGDVVWAQTKIITFCDISMF